MIQYHTGSVPATARVFSRVVAGIDFSPASLAASRWGIANVAPRAEAVVSHVLPPLHASYDNGRLDRAELRARLAETPALRGGLGGFAAMLDVAAARTVVRIGRASHWLSVLVAESVASLLILGRRVDSNRRGIGEPNVLERSARRARASVLVVPEDTTSPPQHIIAAIDRSAAAPHVLRAAEALSRLHACPMIVTHVVGPTVETYDRVIRQPRGRNGTPPSSLVVAERDVAEDSERWITVALEESAAATRHPIHVAAGDPAREIVAVAAAYEAPLIVVGKRGDDGAPAGSLGSVARELLTRAPAPVLVVDEP